MAHEGDQNNKTFTCPMHPEVQSDEPGTCPKCGMELVPSDKHVDRESVGHGPHSGHIARPSSKMSRWQRFRTSMTMTMGMEHSGLAGREMAKLMEEDIKQKFFFALT